MGMLLLAVFIGSLALAIAMAAWLVKALGRLA